MNATEDVSTLVEEYRTLLEDAFPNSAESVAKMLTLEADWTKEGAVHLVDLAKRYGVFMLRNALALAVALEIEDGELGF